MSLGPRFHHRDFPADLLAQRKGAASVTVCFPARNEATTIGAVVAAVSAALVEACPLVDEVLVLDDHSTDDTAAVAADAGARVVAAETVLSEFGPGPGKGQALWKSLYVARGDVIVWCDADIANFDDRFVRGLLGPLLFHDDLEFVKGFYRRPELGPVGGGRVTELVARPLLSLLFPGVAGVVQPLSGEFAARRRAVEQVPFTEGYGVDLALLIDLAERFGPRAIAQVDLDERVDRNRPLRELSPQALTVLAAALVRAGIEVPEAVELLHADGGRQVVGTSTRPPLCTLPSYRSQRESAPQRSGQAVVRR